MGHGHHIEIKQETFVVPARAKQFSMIFMVVGLILAGIGIAKIDKSAAGHDEHAKVEAKAEGHESHEAAKGHEEHTAAAAEHHTEEHANVPNEKFGPRMEYHTIEHPWQTKIWANLLVAGYFFLMISLASMFWITIQYLQTQVGLLPSKEFLKQCQPLSLLGLSYC